MYALWNHASEAAELHGPKKILEMKHIFDEFAFTLLFWQHLVTFPHKDWDVGEQLGNKGGSGFKCRIKCNILYIIEYHHTA